VKFTSSVIIAITLLFSNDLSGQSPQVKHLVDTTTELLKRHSANRDSVNWTNIERTASLRAAGISDPYKLGPVMRYLFQTVNDFHGAFYYKDSIFQWTHDTAPSISDSIMNEWRKGVKIKTSVLSDNIGYLRIPSMPYNGKADADQKASSLNDSLCSLLKKRVRGIILDLRLNGGGAMFPMILGLKNLLDTGQIGSFTGNGEKWYISKNNFLLDTSIITSVRPGCNIDARHIPVVLLIGPGTLSSGEFLTIAFKSRPNTTLLGTATGGYVTSNAGFPINKDVHILIATGYGADSKGRIYRNALKPDMILEGPDSFNDIENDLKVKAALNVLLENLKNQARENSLNVNSSTMPGMRIQTGDRIQNIHR
jgi:carboxyl-terminal processing protease